jgi:hypothetical protein
MISSENYDLTDEIIEYLFFTIYHNGLFIDKQNPLAELKI